MSRKIIYNPESNESLNERRIFGGNPDGMINFTRMKYQWALNLWDTMEANTWFPKETDMTGDKRDYLLLSPAELRMYDLVLAQLIFMDSLQTNNLMDNINPYITAPEVNACLSRQSYEEANHCLIEGTEILTDRGFIDFRELTYEDKVANYYHNGRIFFNYPKEIIHNKFKGDLIEFSMHNYKQIVTPNHRMVMRYPYYKRVIEKDRGKIKIEVAEHASLGNYDIPVAGYNIGQTSTLNIIDRLGIIYQADGTPVNNFNNTKHGYCYRFSFKREDKINRLNQILNSNGIKHTKKISDSGYTHFYVWINFKYDKEFSWITIEDKSSEYISSFIEELSYWDGSIRRKANNNILYTNTNRKAVDKVIALATIGGCQTGVYRIEPNDNNNSNNKITAYQVYIAIGKDHKTGREINKSKIPYDGMTYCCTVDSGMIICRYEDNVFVTGNSKSYAVMVESISDNTDLIYDMWKTDTKLREKNTYIASVYEELSNGELTDTKILLALFANQILEGIYFYAGFAAIYALGKSGKMLGSTQMIRFIQRDEVCLHPDTEILTAIGWVKIGEVKLTDDIAQFDLYDDNITFAKPLHKTWKDYDGEMYKIVDNRGNVIQHITVDHDIVLKYKRTHKLKDGKKYNYYVNKKDTLDNNLFNNTSWMITSGKKHDGDLRKISNYEKLLIALQADGTIDKKRNGVNSGFQVLRFGFKKIRKIERLRNILKSLEKENVHYTESTSNDYTNFYVKVPNKMPIDKNFDWVPIDEVTTKWAMEFLHELQFWDGYIAKDRESLYYSSTNKNAFDKVIAICALSNYKFKTKIYKDNRKETFNDVYRLTWWRHTNLITTQNMKIKNVKYVGKVGCVTMPKGTIITRHEGQVVVTGNCHLLLFQNMINSVRKERPELFTSELEEMVRSMFRKAVELEASWGAYITQGQILGFTDSIIEQYIQYLADRRLEAVGYKAEYNVKHPIPWVDGYASFNSQRTNFFEGNVANYSKGSLDFDDF